MVNNVLSFTCYAAGTLLLCHFGPPHSLTRAEISAKSNYSRLPRALFAKGTHAHTAKSNHSHTSRKFSRKSNHSRTYAKTGGWGLYL